MLEINYCKRRVVYSLTYQNLRPNLSLIWRQTLMRHCSLIHYQNLNQSSCLILILILDQILPQTRPTCIE